MAPETAEHPEITNSDGNEGGTGEMAAKQPETAIHESRLAPDAETFKIPENHLFRKAYRQLSDPEKTQMDRVKDLAWQLRCAMFGTTADVPPASRYQSLALTKLEESVMWAVKHITG
jgi:hypothetical protein